MPVRGSDLDEIWRWWQVCTAREMNAKQLGLPARSASASTGDKHPTYFQVSDFRWKSCWWTRFIGTATRPDGLAIIQCSRWRISRPCAGYGVAIIQLMEKKGPYDFVAKGAKLTYQDMIRPSGLAEVATTLPGSAAQVR